MAQFETTPAVVLNTEQMTKPFTDLMGQRVALEQQRISNISKGIDVGLKKLEEIKVEGMMEDQKKVLERQQQLANLWTKDYVKYKGNLPPEVRAKHAAQLSYLKTEALQAKNDKELFEKANTFYGSNIDKINDNAGFLSTVESWRKAPLGERGILDVTSYLAPKVTNIFAAVDRIQYKPSIEKGYDESGVSYERQYHDVKKLKEAVDLEMQNPQTIQDMEKAKIAGIDETTFKRTIEEKVKSKFSVYDNEGKQNSYDKLLIPQSNKAVNVFNDSGTITKKTAYKSWSGGELPSSFSYNGRSDTKLVSVDIVKQKGEEVIGGSKGDVIVTDKYVPVATIQEKVKTGEKMDLDGNMIPIYELKTKTVPFVEVSGALTNSKGWGEKNTNAVWDEVNKANGVKAKRTKGGNQESLYYESEYSVNPVVADTMVAIRGQETGGEVDPVNAEGVSVNSAVHKGGKAQGMFQIMPVNIPVWYKETYNKDWDGNKLSKEEQEKITATKLTEYYNWAANKTQNEDERIMLMAVKWYGNNGKKLKSVNDIDKNAPGANPTHPSPYEYATQVLQRYKNLPVRDVTQKINTNKPISQDMMPAGIDTTGTNVSNRPLGFK